MKFMYIISFFLFLNFMLILLPRLMPNIITQLIFWIIWVNAIFIFTLVLPHQASYIFPFKSAVTMLAMFKEITSDGAEKDDAKQQEKQQEKQQAKQEKQAKQATPATDSDILKKKIEERKNA